MKENPDRRKKLCHGTSDQNLSIEEAQILVFVKHFYTRKLSFRKLRNVSDIDVGLIVFM